ncbi:MAG TPA: hypothetical protein VJ900_02840, partial [Patescibacteria group bacterium]|nr:hypothetical protein [Patescibacteria group bacterium]
EKENEYNNLQEKQQEVLDKNNELISKRSEVKAKIQILESQLQKEIEQQEKRPQHDNVQITNSNKIFKNINELKNLQENQIKFINEINDLDDLKKIKVFSQKVLNKINSLFDFFTKTSVKKEIKKDFSKEKEIINELKNKLKDINNKIKLVSEKLKKVKNNISNFNNKEQEKREKLLKWQQITQEEQYNLNEVNNKLNQIDIKITRLATKKEDLEAEIKNEIDIPINELLKRNINNESVNYDQISKLKNKLNIIGGIDPSVEQEYPKVKERYDFLNNQTQDLSKTIRSLLKIVKELNQKIEHTFKTNFFQIEKEFNYYFQTIFAGGKAKLSFQEKDNTDETNNSSLIKGIEIFACPPDKKIKNIEMLSGGEKALTALALICAIISINKPPFIILDEADAALDQKNSTRFANILKKLRKHTQFIVITHNQQTIQIADILYGATMTKTGASKLVSLKLEEE